MHILNIKNVYFLDFGDGIGYVGPMKTSYDEKKGNELNRGIGQLNELRRQIQLGELFHETNQPGEIPEGEGEPEDEADNVLAFNGAVGFVVSRQRLRGLLLIRSEKQILQEIQCEEMWDRHMAKKLRGHLEGFEAGCDCPIDPTLN